MEATPEQYREDIAHTLEHIARIDRGDVLGDTPEQAQERRERLVQQVAHLQQGLERAEKLWAQARAQQQSAGGRTAEVGPQEPPQDQRIYNRRQPDGTFRPLEGFFFGARTTFDDEHRAWCRTCEVTVVPTERGADGWWVCPRCAGFVTDADLQLD